MQLSLTATEFTSITTAQAVADAARKGAIEVIQLGKDFRPFFEQACIRTIAAGIDSRKFYEDHLQQTLTIAGQVVSSLLILAFMIAGELTASLWSELRCFVAEQYAAGDFHELWTRSQSDEQQTFGQELPELGCDIDWTDDDDFDFAPEEVEHINTRHDEIMSAVDAVDTALAEIDAAVWPYRPALMSVLED